MTEGQVTGSALCQRLGCVASVLLEAQPELDADLFAAAGQLLDSLVREVRLRPGDGRLWLLLVALTGEYPLHDDVMALRRSLELHDGVAAQQMLLEQCLRLIASSDDVEREMELVTDRPVVDVDFSARNDLMTGIQRVVRHTVPIWVKSHDLVLTCRTDSNAGLRRLAEDETERVVAWHARPPLTSGVAQHTAGEPEAGAPARLVVPWHVPVIVPEVPYPEFAARLSAVAQHSGSPVSLIGYDCIPVISAELVGQHEHEKFISYLDIVKYASTVACISNSSAEEFAGFVDMVRPQGLPGPGIFACPLPSGPTVSAVPPVRRGAGARIVCVGSIDRRKNQIVVLEAAERLWREGYQFSLHFFGSGGLPPADFVEWMHELVAAGRPITSESEVSDETLDREIASARFTVFPSLHEGFGLPVAESLALGVPVLTSDVGSPRELAEGRGGLVVDPRDPDAVTAAMRRLITDDELIAELSALCLAQPKRSWADYADDVWDCLVAGSASHP